MIKFFTDLFKGYRVRHTTVLGKTYYKAQIFVFPTWYTIVSNIHVDGKGNEFNVFVPAESTVLLFQTEHEAYEAIKKVLRTKK